MYHGGLLIPHMEVQPVFLGNAWNIGADKSNVPWLDNYLNYIVGSPFMEGLTRAGYDVGTGTTSPGVLNQLALGKQITDRQIQTDLQKLITDGSVQAPDPDRVYVLFVGKGTVVSMSGTTSAKDFYGYHNDFMETNAAGQKTEVFYVVIPYQAGPNLAVFGPNSMRQSTTFVTAHELASTATDPDFKGWYDAALKDVSDLANFSQSRLSDGKGDSYVVANYVGKNLAVFSLTGWTTLPGTTVALSASAPIIASGQEVTFTITVVPMSGTGSISGTIDILNGNEIIGKATLHLVDGVETATFSTKSLGVGVHVLDAVYAGDSDFLGGFSDPLNVQVA
jgi:hypothetical protein